MTDQIKVTSKARRILMPRWSNRQGADSSSRLGDLTLRKPHYQTAPTSAVNSLFSRNKTFKSGGRIAFQSRLVGSDPAIHPACT
jgi:hypothetical protein